MQPAPLAAAILAVTGACATTSRPGVTAASSAVYVRTDSDATTVVSPHVRVAGVVDDEDRASVEASYTIDAWTGASIDVITAATEAITERRGEANVGGGYALDDARVAANYRHSTESDYWSHGLMLGAIFDLAQKNTSIAVTGLGSIDTVGRAGDPLFREPAWSAGGRLGLVQVLDRNTVAEVSFESTRAAGFLESPYRWVAIGGTGTCAGDAPFCVPEHVPDVRHRHAAAARARRALGDRLSAGLEYRFYLDSWGVTSHTVEPQLTLIAFEAGLLSLRYRYYTQREARFYRPRYFALDDGGGFVTRDRKLSTLFSNEVGLSYLQRIEVGDGDTVVIAGVRSSVSRLDYLAFVGLDLVVALELTATLGIELD